MAKYVSPVSGAFAPGPQNVFGAARSGGGRLHAGDDWHAPAGSPLVAAIGGRVVFVGYDKNAGGYGHFVDVLGADGNVFRYAPHQAVTVKVGQQIATGDQIGVIGAAPGESRGVPHLHMEVMVPGSPAYGAAVKGQFGNTARKHGYVSTVDPAQFFGIAPGLPVAAGQALDAGAQPAVAAGQAAPAMRGGVTPEAQSTYSLLTTGDPRLGVAPLPASVAAGAVGNMMQESYANLRPDAKGAAGELGIGQWMPDRYANMVAWTTANGLDPSSREGQALFYSHELQASPVMAALATAQTPADAAQIIASKFERAGSPMMDRRVGYANAVAAGGD